MEQVTVAQASASLGLSRDRVRKLAASGALRARKAGGIWLMDAQAVEEMVRSATERKSGRPWSPRVAWAILTLLDGDTSAVDSLSKKTRYRIRQRLEAADGLMSIAPRLRGRAVTQRFALHESLHGRLRKAGAVSGPEAARYYGLGLLGGGLDLYIREQHRSTVLASVPLRMSATGSVVVRWVSAGVIGACAVAPRAAVALDLIDDLDPRAQQAGHALTAEVDTWWR